MRGLCLPLLPLSYILLLTHPELQFTKQSTYWFMPQCLLMCYFFCQSALWPHTSPIWKIAACISRKDQRVFSFPKHCLICLGRANHSHPPLFFLNYCAWSIFYHYSWTTSGLVLGQKSEKFGVQIQMREWAKAGRTVRELLQSCDSCALSSGDDTRDGGRGWNWYLFWK